MTFVSAPSALYTSPLTATGVIAVVTGLTALISYFLSRRLVEVDFLPDAPNARSSHVDVTPRSGGLAIFGAWGVSSFLLAALFDGFLVAAAAPAAFPTLAALAFVAFAIGAYDDWRSMSALIKLAGQAAAATLFVLVFGPLESAPIPGLGMAPLGAFAAPVTIFWIVAFMNAYNFMDGVNGIAAVCGAFALCAMAVASTVGGELGWAMASLTLAAALIGFAPSNLQGGRLFMGDNGSQSISFLIACFAVLIAKNTDGRVSAFFAPTAFAPFLFDVGFTLLHRAARRRNVLSAHKEHLYQLLVRLGWSHVSTTCLYLILTAICCAAAMAMFLAPPAWHLAVPAVIAAAFLAPAIRLYRRASREGLLPGRAAQPVDDVADERKTSPALSDPMAIDGSAAVATLAE